MTSHSHQTTAADTHTYYTRTQQNKIHYTQRSIVTLLHTI